MERFWCGTGPSSREAALSDRLARLERQHDRAMALLAALTSGAFQLCSVGASPEEPGLGEGRTTPAPSDQALPARRPGP